jgi:lysyl-tRNA synthetase class 2
MNEEVAVVPEIVAPPMIPILSTNLRAYGYLPGERRLRVEFQNGTSYDYADVTGEVVESFMNSDSKGKFFMSSIRGSYQCTKVEHMPIEKEGA